MSSSPFNAQSVLALDGYLEPFIPAIQHRYEKFKQWKKIIDLHEGGYDIFSKGYDRFGINVQPNGDIVYREWAPNATEAFFIGDFSKWRSHDSL
jgi:1,4-alpha-glucan branching enzyme